MATNDRLAAIELMLRSVLMGHEPSLISWVSGYVYGETANGDPYIALYHPAPGMKDKICKVYEQDWAKLPDFVTRPSSEDDTPRMKTSRRKPTLGKDEAMEAGIYQECFMFEVVMHMGRRPSDNAEREKRFLGVTRVTNRFRQGYEPDHQQRPTAPQSQAKETTSTTVPAGEFIINNKETAISYIATETGLDYAQASSLYEVWKKRVKPSNAEAMWTAVREETRHYLSANGDEEMP